MTGKNAFLSNLNKTDLWTFKLKDKFVKEIVEIWTEINFQKQLRSTNEYEQQYLWNNSLTLSSPCFFGSSQPGGGGGGGAQITFLLLGV